MLRLMRVELFIALRYLLRRRKAGFISVISLISVLGVAVGVMALIVVLSVMSGFDRELKLKIVGSNPHVMISDQGGIADYDALITTVKGFNLPQVYTIAPYINGQGIIRSDNNASGVFVRGIDPAREDMQFFNRSLRLGSMDFSVPDALVTDQDRVRGGVVIGYTLARTLYVQVGDIIQIISPHIEKKGVFGKTARTASFRVNGIYQFGMNDVDSSLVLIDIANAQYLYDLGDKVTGLGIKLHDVYWAERIKGMIHDRFEHTYWVQTWIDMNRNFFAALKVEKHVMAILLFLIILVAAFNIVSTLIMVVMEKTKDIGVLKALGVTKPAIKRIFILEGMLVGFFGTVCGVISGLSIAAWLNPIADFIQMTTGFEVFPSDIYYFDSIPTQTNIRDVVFIALFAFVATVVAGMYPAQRAASLHPVEALRYE